MLKDNKEIAYRLIEFKGARDELGIINNEQVEIAIKIIKRLPYRLVEFYTNNKRLPGDITKYVKSVSINNYIIEAIINDNFVGQYYNAEMRKRNNRKLNKEKRKATRLEDFIF